VPERIGLDLGTTSISGVLLDVGGVEPRLRHVARRRNDSALPAPLPARAEQDAGRLRALALDVLAELASRAVDVEAVGVTGQMHGLLCVDRAGEPLTPLIGWQDRRTAEALPIQRGDNVPGRQAAGGGDGRTVLDELISRLDGLRWQDNGCQIAHGYGAATLFWMARHGAIPRDTARACSLPDWLAAQLAGRLPATDPTLACSWGVYSVVGSAWNARFIERLSLDANLFPPVLPSGRVLGGLASQVAGRVGLPAGIPVLNAIGDHPASLVGSVRRPAGALHVNLGTGGQIAWWRPAFESPDERVETHPFPGDGCLRVGASLCGGAAYAWLNRTIRAWLAEFGLDLPEETVYERLNLAAEAADPAGLAVRTTFLGVRGRPEIRAGAIEGITLDNLRPGALARATLLGLIDELRELYRSHAVEAVRAGHRLLAASGNAVQKNPLLPGLLAEQFGLPVDLPRWDEPAAVGAALVAAS
jgi:sedoheptulokinase